MLTTDLMKIEQKLVQNVRINPQRALALRGVIKRIQKETGVTIKESEVIGFLIDECCDRIKVVGDEVKVL